MDANTGWICPTCKRGVRPDEKTCDHGGGLLASHYPNLPLAGWLPQTIPNQPLCACAPGTVCGNVACPYAAKVTCSQLTASAVYGGNVSLTNAAN